MRFTGHLGLADVEIPGVDVELEVERRRVVLRRCDEPLGGWDLAACDLEHDTGRRFILKLHAETFTFEADDPLRVQHDAVPAFASDVRPSRWWGRQRFHGMPQHGPAASSVRTLLLTSGPGPLDARRVVRPGVVADRRRAAGLAVRHRTVRPHQVEVAYLDVGSGPPVLFLDGGIAGIELWRGVLPFVSPQARCVALDLAGTGLSGPMPAHASEPWSTHAALVDALLDDIGIGDDVTLVMHGWGSLIGMSLMLDVGRQVRGLCHIDAIVTPHPGPEVAGWYADVLRDVRSTSRSRAPLEPAALVDRIVSALTLDPLPERVLADLLRPFEEDTESRALLGLLRSLPFEGGSPASTELVRRGWDLLTRASAPKLLIVGQPGFFLQGRHLARAMTLDGQTVATVEGRHFLPLESPEEVGRFIAMWINLRR